jgi:transposase InsO family protein
VITPVWRQKPWFGDLTRMQASQARLLPHSSQLFLPASRNNEMGIGLPPWQQTVAWNIDGSIQDDSIDFDPVPLNSIIPAVNHQDVDDVMQEDEQISLPESINDTNQYNGLIIDSVDHGTQVRLVEDINLREQLINRAHLAGHFGANVLIKKILSEGHIWPTMRADIIMQLKECINCLRYNIAKKGFHPLRTITAKLPFDHVAVDLAELPQSDAGYSYVLLLVDLATKFVFLRPLKNKEMTTVASQLFSIFCDVGFPKIIQSDNGSEFSNKIATFMAELANIDHRLISAYHPRGNGAAEREVQTMKNTILKCLNGLIKNWELHIPSTQFYINTKIAHAHNSTPFALMYARPVNGLTRYQDTVSELLSSDELLARLKFMTEIVYPTIFPALVMNKVSSGSGTSRSWRSCTPRGPCCLRYTKMKSPNRIN